MAMLMMNNLVLCCTMMACFINVGTSLYDASLGSRPQNLPLVAEHNTDTDSSNSNLRAKRFFREQQRSWTMEQIIEAVLCVFIPPAAVLIHGGHDMLLHMVINIVLWICGWIPGMVHALWYCFYRD
uniref:Plasma membrane proteolipid 3 n=1 Tax=Globodera rostochiensis TaxID=31243 RepID=A0A914H860_GLORO